MGTIGTQSASRFLDLKALASLEHMRFTTKHRIEGTYSGRHVSRQQGGAAEFVDFREYVEGEDLRRLDWKVLARTGRAYTRLYQDETNLSCTLVLDASGSMRFGEKKGTQLVSAQKRAASPFSGSKLEYAQYLATALSQVISRQQDQVGLAVVSEGLKEFLAPGAALVAIGGAAIIGSGLALVLRWGDARRVAVTPQAGGVIASYSAGF